MRSGFSYAVFMEPMSALWYERAAVNLIALPCDNQTRRRATHDLADDTPISQSESRYRGVNRTERSGPRKHSGSWPDDKNTNSSGKATGSRPDAIPAVSSRSQPAAHVDRGLRCRAARKRWHRPSQLTEASNAEDTSLGVDIDFQCPRMARESRHQHHIACNRHHKPSAGR
jgi:hypothetical protein